MHGDIKEVLFPADIIRERVQTLGAEIGTELGKEPVVVLALLKGGVIFLADLIRAINHPLQLEFAWASSYGSGQESSGEVDLKVFPDEDLTSKTVIVVDDILDTGRTLKAVCDRLQSDRKVSNIKTCVLLDKKARRAVDLDADYVGFLVDDHFVVGYGLDYAGRYRNLPYIGILKEATYQGQQDS